MSQKHFSGRGKKITVNYDPEQSRDEHGRWTSDSASYDTKSTAADLASQKAGSTYPGAGKAEHEQAAHAHTAAAKAARRAAGSAPTPQDANDMKRVAGEHERQAKYHNEKAAPTGAPKTKPIAQVDPDDDLVVVGKMGEGPGGKVTRYDNPKTVGQIKAEKTAGGGDLKTKVGALLRLSGNEKPADVQKTLEGAGFKGKHNSRGFEGVSIYTHPDHPNQAVRHTWSVGIGKEKGVNTIDYLKKV